MRKKLTINNYTWFLDIDKRTIYENEKTLNGIKIDSKHITNAEYRQIADFIRFGN